VISPVYNIYRYPGDLGTCGEVAVTYSRDAARSEVTLPENVAGEGG